MYTLMALAKGLATKTRVLLLALLLAGSADRAGAVDVQYDYTTDRLNPGGAYSGTDIGGSASGYTPGTASGWYSSGSHYIYNNVLYESQAQWTTIDGGMSSDYWGNVAYRWEAVGWSNPVNITNARGFATGTGGSGITGSGNTVNLSGSGTIGGTIAGLLRLHTNDLAGNTLRIGYRNNTTTQAGGSISANGTADVGYGNIIMVSGTINGTGATAGQGAIIANTAGPAVGSTINTVFSQSGGDIGSTAVTLINMQNANSTGNYFNKTGGSIAQTTINVNGAGSTNTRFRQSAGTISGNSTINMLQNSMGIMANTFYSVENSAAPYFDPGTLTPNTTNWVSP